jgi:hybrid polyketide synthase/nonribosomal peptide synthetase ACE1
MTALGYDRIPVTPFVFSAASESSLIAQLRSYSDHLNKREELDPYDLAWTLQARRSEFAIKVAFSAATISQLKSKIDTKLAEVNNTLGSILGIRAKPGATKPKVLGIFTGQGAQWPGMGSQLIRSSEFVRRRLHDLEESLATLPPPDRPVWHLQEQILAEADASRISEAALSQPLCTALQIILVDLLREAGVTFSAVVGHSSGEIAAAYAAGFVSAGDAIRIAYYRGVYVQEAQQGAMLAVGTSWEDASKLTHLRTFRGRLAVAAHNSSASVTMSGDVDAIVHAKKVFEEEKKSTRLLKVDKAYHSHHMLPCGDAYVKALRACAIGTQRDQRSASCAWFSSVTPSFEAVNSTEGLQDVYWRDNMTSPVLFADAVRNAVASDNQINLVIEVGPHPALKGPATQNISDARSEPLPYCGTLSRGNSDVEAFSDSLSFIWMHTGSRGVDFQRYSQRFQGELTKPRLVVGLPSYRWYHGRSHWSEPRRSRRIRSQKQPPHELLGILSPDSNSHDLRWSNVLKPAEISWLNGHKLQGQRVFPAAGYVAMALEASRALDSHNTPIELFELHELSIPKAITFEEADNSGVETLVTLTNVQHQDFSATACFSCYALPIISTGSEHELELMATGTAKVVFGTPSVDALSLAPQKDYNMFSSDPDRFYSSLADLGYGYSGPFRAMSTIRRKLNHATAVIDSYPYADSDLPKYLVHPCTLDMAFQLAILAYSAPGDGQLWSLYVPTSIQSIRVNPEICASMTSAGTPVPAVVAADSALESFSADIDLLSEDSRNGMVQIEGLVVKPFASATKADDRVVFTSTKFDLAVPDGSSIVEGARPSADEVEGASACERISYYYHRKWKSEITESEWTSGPPHQKLLRDWVNDTLSRASAGQHASLKKQWSEDSAEDIKALAHIYWHLIDIRLLTAVGENMAAAVRGETTILEHMVADNMLDKYYEKGIGLSTYHSLLATMTKLITHRYPRAKFIEIGEILHTLQTSRFPSTNYLF